MRSPPPHRHPKVPVGGSSSAASGVPHGLLPVFWGRRKAIMAHFKAFLVRLVWKVIINFLIFKSLAGRFVSAICNDKGAGPEPLSALLLLIRVAETAINILPGSSQHLAT